MVHGEELPLCRQIKYVLVDEYQDTNKVQAEILLLLSGLQNNLMVVGDDAQSIYSWRGADFGNMLEFPEKYIKQSHTIWKRIIEVHQKY